MTDLNNSNAEGEQPNTTPSGGHDDALDADWAAFAAAHADDLKDVEHSRNARRFERHAQRKEKEALLHVDDLSADAFVGAHGPRDATNSSWLDVDDVMDRYGDDFTPPDPKIGPVSASKLVFWVLLVAGVIGVIASVFVPALTGLLGTVFGAAALIGGAGLIIRHKGHAETREDWFDDGARV